MRQHYYVFPFGVGGSITPAIPNATDPSGYVSYEEGWTFDYQRNLLTDPLAKSPTYINLNALLNDATTALQDLQNNGNPEWIDASDNGGTAFSYRIGAVARWSSAGTPPFGLYVNLVDNNTVTPGTDTSWKELTAFFTEARIRLTANLNLYIATTGSDTNNGLTTGTPFLTRQKAWNTITNNYDLNGFSVTVNMANGTYTDEVFCTSPPVGVTGSIRNEPTQPQPNIIFLGNTTTPDDVIISVADGNCFHVGGGAQIIVNGCKLAATGTSSDFNSEGCGLFAFANGGIQFLNIDFGACSAAHISSSSGSTIQSNSNPYTISGSAPNHIAAVTYGYIATSGSAVTITGTPAFSSAFAVVDRGAILADSMTFTGGATGSRYLAVLNGVLDTGGAQSSPTTNYLPGNAAGTTSTGGQVV